MQRWWLTTLELHVPQEYEGGGKKRHGNRGQYSTIGEDRGMACKIRNELPQVDPSRQRRTVGWVLIDIYIQNQLLEDTSEYAIMRASGTAN